MNEHEKFNVTGKRLWSSDLELGIPIIDRQHQQLVNNIEELFFAIKHNKDYDKIRGLTAFIKRYSIEHFQTEEEYMKKFMYPRVAEHTKKHNDFHQTVLKVEEFVRVQATSPVALQIVESLMLRWYVEHIKSMDQEFAGFLRENNLVKDMK